MTDNLNVNGNQSEYDIVHVFTKDSVGDMMSYSQEITIMKTEVKEELYDNEVTVNDTKHVKDEDVLSPQIIFEEEDFGVIKTTEHVSNESFVAGNSQLTEEAFQKKQKLSKNSLKRRILVKQDGEPKNYKCPVCNYTTQSKSHLEQHIPVHINEKPFKCTYKNCKCTAGQQESCKCNMCWYTAARKDTLKLHILRKHSAEPKKPQLEQRMRIHTTEGPFKCTYKNCECTAGQQESCKCDMCGYASTDKRNLKSHILRKHSAKPKSTSVEIASKPLA